MKKLNISFGIIGVLLVLVFWFGSSMYQKVPAGYVGVATLFGEAIPIVISVSIFSGISNAFQSDKDFNLNLLFTPEIFFPLLALAIMSLVANYIKKKYFN